MNLLFSDFYSEIITEKSLENKSNELIAWLWSVIKEAGCQSGRLRWFRKPLYLFYGIEGSNPSPAAVFK